MKRFLPVVLLFISVLGVWLLTRGGDPPYHHPVGVTPEKVAGTKGGRESLESPGIAREDGTSTREVKPGAPDPSTAVVSAEDGFIRKVVAQKWLDEEGKLGRQRVRIVEADFKYPRLRLVEEVTVDPLTGEEKVNRLSASVADHLAVGLKSYDEIGKARQIIEESGYAIRREEEGSYLLVELEDFDDPEAQARHIGLLQRLDEFVDYAEPDWLVYPNAVPNDAAFAEGKMWGFHNPGSIPGTVADADIDAPEAWDVRNDASNVTVAVTDMGIRYTHEDLAPNMWTNANGEYGYDAYDVDTDPMDTDGHGTHCAGTIGAYGNNGVGTAGVAWKVKLMALRFLGPNGGATSDAITVINYARISGADIISASWGGDNYSHGLAAAIDACHAADIPFVAAAGNDSRNTDAIPHYPSSYESPNIVSVASTESTGRLSHFSNFGFTTIDLAAPGGDIWSCGVASDSDYRYLSGTSMAAPQVAGALALAKAHFPGESSEDLITRLHSSVDELSQLGGIVATGGRLNVCRLLENSSPIVYHDYFNSPRWFTGFRGYWSGTNKRMTRETDENSYSPGTGNRSLWFRWTAPTGGLVRLRGSATKEDVSVVVFEGDNKSSLVRIADNFGARPATTSHIHFYASAGKTYSFSLDSRSSLDQTIIAELRSTPENDMLADAILLSAGGEFHDEKTNSGASAEPFETLAPHAGVGTGHSVWWKWTPGFSGNHVISTFGSEFDTVMAVYTGSPGALTEVASNDDRGFWD